MAPRASTNYTTAAIFAVWGGRFAVTRAVEGERSVDVSRAASPEGTRGNDVGVRLRPTWRSTRALLVLAAVGSYLFVACSSGAGAGIVDESITEDVLGSSANAAPEFALEVFANENYASGEIVSLSDFEGQPVIVNFWYPSCPPCRLEMPDLEATFQKYKDDGLQLIGVMALVLDSAEEGQEFIDDFGITYAVGPDAVNQILIDYKVSAYPTSVFLDRNHEIVRTWAGVLTEDKLEELVGPLLQ